MTKHLYKNKLFQLLLTLFILSSFSLVADPAPQLVDTFENGNLYQTGELRIIELEGSYRDMGRQYGALAKDHLSFFCGENEDLENTCHGMFRDLLDNLIDKTWDLYPERQQEILLGMSETSGLCIRQLMIMDQNLAISFFLRSGFACSYLSAWDDYSADGKVVVGRNFDWYPMHRKLSKEVVVVVFKPNDGSLSTAIVVFNGMISALTGINEKGVYLSLNNGMNTFGPVVYHNRAPYLNMLHEFLWNSDDIDSLSKKMHDSRAQFPNIVNIADSKVSYSMETSPYETIKRSGHSPGFLVATNHMMHQDWGVIPLPCPTESFRRYKNLMTLGETGKGVHDVSTFKTILDQPLYNKDGDKTNGATVLWEHTHNPNVTIYQVVCTPETREMWIKVPSFVDWTHVDLKPFLLRG